MGTRQMERANTSVRSESRTDGQRNNYKYEKKTETMRILVTNDDGVGAKGLRELVDCIPAGHEVYVVAPDEPQSGKSSAITVNAALRWTAHPEFEGAKAYSVNGTPVDCVKLAMHTILPERPDLLLSGINHGTNAGCSIIYSGTMGAAFEACIQNVPAVGFSLLHSALDADFSKCKPWVKKVIADVIEKGLPDYCCLNINFPAKVEIEGLKVVAGARSHWTEEYKEYLDPHGHPFYMMTGKLINEEPDNDETDLYWLDRNWGTVVPATPDQNLMSAIKSVRETLLGK